MRGFLILVVVNQVDLFLGRGDNRFCCLVGLCLRHFGFGLKIEFRETCLQSVLLLQVLGLFLLCLLLGKLRNRGLAGLFHGRCLPISLFWHFGCADLPNLGFHLFSLADGSAGCSGLLRLLFSCLLLWGSSLSGLLLGLLLVILLLRVGSFAISFGLLFGLFLLLVLCLAIPRIRWFARGLLGFGLHMGNTFVGFDLGLLDCGGLGGLGSLGRCLQRYLLFWRLFILIR